MKYYSVIKENMTGACHNTDESCLSETEHKIVTYSESMQ